LNFNKNFIHNRYFIKTSVAGPGCFLPDPGSGSDHFLISDPGSRIRIQTFFIPDPGSYLKSGMQTYFFLASFNYKSKVFVPTHSQKDPGSEIRKKIHPRSGSRIQGVKKAPDTRGKKAPDPGCGTLIKRK
jgi:hypothetical protein